MKKHKGITRRTLVAAAAGSLAAGSALARPPIMRGGHPHSQIITPPDGGGDGGPPPTGVLFTFQVTNTVAATSLGCIRIGLPIKARYCPAGSHLEIWRGTTLIPAQFDNRAAWTYDPAADGLHFCTACLRDTNFAANETRTYSVFAKTGVFNNTSAVTLANVIAGSDYKVEFTGVIGEQTGSLANTTASLNTHASLPTRVTKYESGPVCDLFIVWGMAKAGAQEDNHLKTECHITRWKDAAGNRIADEICFIVRLDWWSIPGKQKLTYDAQLKNGATVLETYSNVGHIYQMTWGTFRLANDDQHARRHWVGAARPTLNYKPDRDYWRQTRIAPPYDETLTSGAGNFGTIAFTYVPGSGLGHRTNTIDGTGAYPGEGLWSGMDIQAFSTWLPSDIRTALVAGMWSLHVPFHHRSNNTRTRPGEVSDTANTLPSLIMQDERGAATPSSYYDFQADGMPAPTHSYIVGGASYSNGYIKPPGPGSPVSGAVTWTGQAYNGILPSHLIIASDFCYVYSGERYYIDAAIEVSVFWGIMAIPTNELQAFAAPVFVHSSPTFALYPNAAADVGKTWKAVTGHSGAGTGTTRAGAGAIKSMCPMTLYPDGYPPSRYFKALMTHVLKYTERSFLEVPAEGNGAWSIIGGSHSNFMYTYLTLSTYFAYCRTRRPIMKAMAEYVAKHSIQYAQYNKVGMASCYTAVATTNANMKALPWQTYLGSPTWDFWTGGWFGSCVGATISAATDVITFNGVNLPIANGDKVCAFDANDAVATVVPAELTMGVIYYMVQVSGFTFKLAHTVGGTPINFASDYKKISFGVRLASAANSPNPLALGMGSYGNYVRSAFAIAQYNNHPLATLAYAAKYDEWYKARTTTQPANWRMKVKTV